MEIFSLTLMAVSASEALLTLAGELASSLAPAAPMRPTHVGRDVAHTLWCTIGRNGYSAAINH